MIGGIISKALSWQFERERVIWEEMKEGLLIREYHVLLTDVDFIRSFTGSLAKISVVVSAGRSLNDVGVFLLLDGQTVDIVV